MEIIRTHQLSPAQQQAVSELITCCRTAAHQHLSYPCEEAVCHYLLYNEKCQLCSIYSVLPSPEPAEIECLALTHPDARKQGYFKLLLEACSDDYEETDIIFPVDPEVPEVMAVMAALEADCLSTNYLMERNLSEYSTVTESVKESGYDTDLDFELTLKEESADIRTLFSDTVVLGHCHLKYYGSSVCLHHVEILAEYRRRGYARQMIELLLTELGSKGITRLFLHVQADNRPAVSLYKKTGFRITKTLSYYLF